MLNKKTFDLRKMVITGVLGAISVVFGMTPIGFIPIGPTRATIMHIPVIIGAIMEGPIVGGLIGLIFGIFSIYQAITAPTVVSFVFLNPIVSVVPRVLIGLVAYYVYSFVNKVSKKNTMGLLVLIWLGIVGYLIYGIYTNIVAKAGLLMVGMNVGLLALTSLLFYMLIKKSKGRGLDIILSAGIGTLTNTVGVLSMIYIFFGEKFVSALGADINLTRKIIVGIGISNGIPEAIIAIIVVTSVVGALKKTNL